MSPRAACRLRRAALEGDPSARAEAVMEVGPSTVRPDVALGDLVERMQARQQATAIVTTPEGRLVGVVRRADTEISSSGRSSLSPTPAE